jgi:PAS domain S-box-containing protein
MDQSAAADETIEAIRTRLAEAEETLQAIRSGAVDAVVIDGPDGPRVYTLKGADEPYRILVERMKEGALTLSEDGVVLFANGSFADLVGAPLEQVIGGPLDRFLPERERPRFTALLQSARSASLRQEFALQRVDGAELACLLSLGPLQVDEDVLVISIIASDLTEQKRTEQAVAAERFLRSILEQAAEPIIICDAAGTATHASQAALALWGGKITGQPLTKALARLSVDGHASKRGLADQLRRVLKGHVLSGVEVRLADEGRGRHYLLSAGPLYDAREQVTGCMVMLTDITARKRAEEHHQVLLAELSHRVKNTLAGVRSIARQTLRHAPSVEAFRGAFEGRLQALAGAHGLLTQSGWSEAELGSLIRQAVLPYLEAHAESITLSGPATHLTPRQVVTMTLVMHELAVNAAKYGALSRENGRVAIEWTVDRQGPERVLHLRWAESGGPLVRAPDRTGFGTALIERSIAHELDGHTRLEYSPDGLVCELHFPLRGAAADLLREAETSADQLRSDFENNTLP